MTDQTSAHQSPVRQKVVTHAFGYTMLKQSGRHMPLPRLVTLPFALLCNLDIESNTFYDRAHQLNDTALFLGFILNMI